MLQCIDNKNNRKNVIDIFTAITGSIILSTISSQLTSTAFAASSDVGFQDGLSDCQTGTSNAINGHSNAGHHSAAYMDAYNRGLASCNGGGPTSSSQPSSEDPATTLNKAGCYVAVGIFLGSGVDSQTVSGLGHDAHNSGICPQNHIF